MKKTVIGVIVAIIVVAGVGMVLVNSNKKDKSDTSSKTGSNDSAMSDMKMTENDSASPDASQSNATANAVATSEVAMKNTAFTQTKITVKVGTKVTWTNEDGVQHDVAPDKDYGDAFKGSELLSKGQTYSFTFTKAGTYTYHCTPHPFMKATVVVTE